MDVMRIVEEWYKNDCLLECVAKTGMLIALAANLIGFHQLVIIPAVMLGVIGGKIVCRILRKEDMGFSVFWIVMTFLCFSIFSAMFNSFYYIMTYEEVIQSSSLSLLFIQNYLFMILIFILIIDKGWVGNNTYFQGD